MKDVDQESTFKYAAVDERGPCARVDGQICPTAYAMELRVSSNSLYMSP